MNLAVKWLLPRHLKGSLTCRKSVTWDQRLYFRSEGRHTEDFFALKNPRARTGFEPACERLLLNFLWFWQCISIYACNEINLMHHLSSVYSVTILLHVLGLLVHQHQEVTMYICDNWYVLYVLFHCQLQPTSPKHVEYSDWINWR
jgi:hypothetical protein